LVQRLRPYLWLAVQGYFINHAPIPLNFKWAISGALNLLDTSATIIASRDNLVVIDKQSMREIISFIEGNIMGTFTRPDNAMKF